MSDLLDKATFWPPAFARETTLKMGPSLQKIIGSDMTALSRVEEATDVSLNILSKVIPVEYFHCTEFFHVISSFYMWRLFLTEFLAVHS